MAVLETESPNRSVLYIRGNFRSAGRLAVVLVKKATGQIFQRVTEARTIAASGFARINVALA